MRKSLSLYESCLHQLSQITKLIFVDRGRLGACVKIVLFLYANTLLDPAVSPVIREIRKNQLIGSCFSSFLAGENRIYHPIDYLGKTRTKLTRIFYGNQGLFIKKNIFSTWEVFQKFPL